MEIRCIIQVIVFANNKSRIIVELFEMKNEYCQFIESEAYI